MKKDIKDLENWNATKVEWKDICKTKEEYELFADFLKAMQDLRSGKRPIRPIGGQLLNKEELDDNNKRDPWDDLGKNLSETTF